MKGDQILAIDNGTQSVRALLFDPRGTVINLDREGQPLRPAILWLDQRRAEGLKPIGGIWGAAFRVAGVSSTVAHLQEQAEANWIRTHKYLFLSGYLTYRLTGQFTDSVGCQVGYVPFDYRRHRWSGRRDWKWLAVPMDPTLRCS